MATIQNQYFVKNNYKDTDTIYAIRCNCCDESTHVKGKLPVSLKGFIEISQTFIKLHDIKGCNKKKIKQPYWAAEKISFGVNIKA